MNPWCRHFEAAQHAFRNFDLEGALEHLARVQAFAPNLAGARNGIAKIRQRQADIARVQLAYETARAGGRLVSARGAVEAWSKLVDPESPELQAAMVRGGPGSAPGRVAGGSGPEPGTDRSCGGARSLSPEPGDRRRPSRRADRLETHSARPADRARRPGPRRSHSTFVDAPASRRAGPAHLRRRAQGGRSACCIRGTARGSPRSAPASSTTCTRPPGDTVGYAVLSKRGGVESVTAISLGPFVFLADVKDVRVELHHHEVELAWTLPRGVSDVRVIRKQGGPPRNPRDGERIPAALDHALDRNVDPNEVYHYGIYAIYAMSDGRLVPSPGVVVSARPQPPVSALEAPRLLLEPGRTGSH